MLTSLTPYQVFEGFFALFELEDLRINHWVDVIALKSPNHVLKHRTAPDVDTPNRADVVQSIQQSRLRLFTCAQKSNQVDNAFHLNTM